MPLIQLNKSMFIHAEHTPPSAWAGHIPFGAWLVEAIRPDMIVELGTHYGTSYLAFCQTVEANQLPTRCFAVDTWEGDEHAGVYGEEIYEELHGYHSRKYAAFSRLMRMTFDDAVAYFADGSIDLLHIDGLHTYDAVRHDFETWLPKLSARAVVIFHDTCVREREFGVWRFWAELRDRYPSFEFTHSHGLGIVAVGSEIPSQLQALLSKPAEDEAWLVNQMFESLGSVIESRAEMERLTRAVAHERACRREDAANVAAAFGDTLGEQVERIRRDVAHVANLVATNRPEVELVETRLRESVDLLQGEVRVGVDAVRHDIAYVRDTLAAAGESASHEWRQRSIELSEAMSSSTGALEAQLAEAAHVLRSDVSTVRNELLGAGSKQASSLLDGVARVQEGIEELLGAGSRQTTSVLEGVERVQEGIEELKDRGLGARLRRLMRRDAS